MESAGTVTTKAIKEIHMSLLINTNVEALTLTATSRPDASPSR